MIQKVCSLVNPTISSAGREAVDHLSSNLVELPTREFDQITADVLAVMDALYAVYPHPVNIAWVLGARSREKPIRNSMNLLRLEGLIGGPDAAAFFTQKGHASIAPTVNPAVGKTDKLSAACDLMEMSEPGKMLLNFLKAHLDALT